MKLLQCLFLIFAATLVASEITPELIRKINTQQSQWVAGPSKFANQEHFKALLGTILGRNPSGKTLSHSVDVLDELPESFDAREQWPNCPTISHIRDQAACGSCWAFATAEVVGDRLCIHSDGAFTAPISTEDLNSCCRACGYGCQGGFMLESMQYWVDDGLVTGGDFNTTDGCKAYSIPPCDHHVEGALDPCGELTPTPACKKQCDSSSKLYKSELTYGKTAYYVDSKEAQIRAEIFKNGPVTAAFTVYEDFEAYQSGVYEHTTGPPLGGHAVKLMGWGVEKEVPYWLAANSWNEDWGDKGTFKIVRGKNNCGIEAEIVGGLPKLG